MNWCCIVDFEKEVASCLFASQLKREELIGRASFPVGGPADNRNRRTGHASTPLTEHKQLACWDPDGLVRAHL